MRQSQLAEIIDTISLLTPWEATSHRKRRFGNKESDGGYVLLDDLLQDQVVISCGIGGDVSFDLELAELGLHVWQFDHSVQGPPVHHDNFHFHPHGIAAYNSTEENMRSLGSILEKTGEKSVILKMDIEDAEWDALDGLTINELDKIDMIAIEFHYLDRIGSMEGRKKIDGILRLLSRRHFIYHVHANNGMGAASIGHLQVPRLLEVSYVRSKLVARSQNKTVYPSRLDPPNVSGPELPLWSFPFLPALHASDLAAAVADCASRIDAGIPPTA